MGRSRSCWICVGRLFHVHRLHASLQIAYVRQRAQARPAAWCCDPSCAKRETSLFGSFKSPKTIALGEQDCTQAGLNSPSFRSRFSPSAWISAARMRCTQNVHFSMMPTLRTETSGFSCRCRGFSQTGL